MPAMFRLGGAVAVAGAGLAVAILAGCAGTSPHLGRDYDKCTAQGPRDDAPLFYVFCLHAP